MDVINGIHGLPGSQIENPYVQYMYSYPHKTAYRSLSGVNLKEYGKRLEGKGHSLYLHIPFCQSKCGYCNLFSVTGQGKEDIDRYLDAVERQVLQYRELLTENETGFSDITIGGGTPLLLSEAQLERMFSILGHCILDDQSGKRNLTGNICHKPDIMPDIVIETAPNQTDRGKLQRLKDRGVTRVSMGIQSFSDKELSVLGRRHCGKKAREALELLKAFDFPCVNIDFIYGIPGQTADSLLRSLKEGLAFCPDEIFLYPLYVKHGAWMGENVKEGMVLTPKEAFFQYRQASLFLRGEGYRQDSMRRFVRQKRERPFSGCGFSSSLSLGCGGRSYLDNLHFCTPYAVTREGCLVQIRKFEEDGDYTQIRHGIFLSEEEMKRRYVIKHLLIYPGLPVKQYQARFKAAAEEDFPLLNRWEREGFLEYGKSGGETFLALTDAGLGLSDYLGPQLISREVEEKMKEWDRWFCTGVC